MYRSILRVVMIGGCFSALLSAGTITFNRDVLPILQKNCQGCHRPGEIGPMPLLTYQQTRPWAKAIKASTLSRKMPPWFADPHFGHFRNDRTMSEAEIRTISTWVDSGAPEGEAADKPAPVNWPDHWNIQPDLVFQMPYGLHGAGQSHPALPIYSDSDRVRDGHLGHRRGDSPQRPVGGASHHRRRSAARV